MTDKETSTSAPANTAAASTANPPPAPPAAEAIEEDDEFEEFEPCHWDKRDEDAEDSQQWQVGEFLICGGVWLWFYHFCYRVERDETERGNVIVNLIFIF